MRVGCLSFLVIAGGLAGNVSADATAFVGVNLIPMDANRVLMDQTVLIEDGKIVAIGKNGTIKPLRKAVILHGEGKFLLPGLSDMHAHIFPN